MKTFQWSKKALPVLFVVILLAFVSSVLAQTSAPETKGSLRAWTGVWTFSDDKAASNSLSSLPKTTVEIFPTADGKGIQITRKAIDQPEVKEVIIPDGSKRAVNDPNCTGFQTATLIPGAGMIVSSSEMTCKDTGAFATNNVKLILSADKMVDILELKANGDSKLAVRHLKLERDLPPVDASEPTNANVIARMTVGQSWNLNKVEQIAQSFDTRLLEAVLVEKQVVLDMNKATLKQLKNSKLSKGIVDLLVALAYPDKFKIAKNGQVELKRWANTSTSSGNSGRLYTPTYSYSYVPSSGYYYPGAFYNCGGFYPNIYGGLSCWSYYSPFWSDYPFHTNWRPNITIVEGSGGGGSAVPPARPDNNVRLSAGGYVQIEQQPSSRQAQPRNQPLRPLTTFSGQSSVNSSSGSTVIYSAPVSSSSSSSSSGGSGVSSSSGSSSGGVTVSPGGYSSGSSSGGGERHAVPR
jgi:hypothetical protein